MAPRCGLTSRIWAGSTANNIWEVPDLFELTIDDDPAHTRWVLVISVNHGSIWGGSGVQYFIGDFDGTRFVAEASDTIDALTPPSGDLIADFEGGQLPSGWRTGGSAFGTGPVAGALQGQQFVSGHLGRGVMNSFHGGDVATGTLASPTFLITRPWLSFQIAGGSSPLTRLELRVGNQVVRQASGDDTETLKWRSWEVSALIGQQAVLRAVDEATGSWGHILLDHLVMGDAPVPQVANADITLWADHGRDFYAPITFSNLPNSRVLWMGWMSNWDYARDVPTQPWRGQQSGVRELSLVTTPRGLRLRQRMAAETRSLVDPAARLQLRQLRSTQVASALAGAAPNSRQFMARLVVNAEGLQRPIGLELFKGDAESVKVGFDPNRKTFFVDRRTAAPRFQGQSERHDAARLLDAAQISLEVWVDGSTLEVFADDGTVVLSDLVHSDPRSTGIGLFHGEEDPLVQNLDLHHAHPSMYK